MLQNANPATGFRRFIGLFFDILKADFLVAFFIGCRCSAKIASHTHAGGFSWVITVITLELRKQITLPGRLRLIVDDELNIYQVTVTLQCVTLGNRDLIFGCIVQVYGDSLCVFGQLIAGQ